MKNRLFYLLLALLALAAAVVGAAYWRANYLAGVTLINLPVPRADIPPYTLLDMEMFTVSQFPRALVDEASADYALTLDDLMGHITTGTLVSGLPVPQTLAVPPAAFRLADPALEVASIPVSPVNGVGGQIQVGELVNIYRLKREQEMIEGEVLSEEIGDAIRVATAPVVAVLSEQGLPASTDPDEIMPMQILVVAGPPEVIDRVLEAVAMSELGNELLWVTLATPSQ